MNKTSAAIVRTLLLGTSCLSVFGLHAAMAQPTGGSVALGSATIADHGGNSTTINQTTGKAVINWNSFSIAAGGTVQFNQPGASSITLNRVIGPESSAIYGSLLANGQVWLINGNGVLFGQGSRINVGGLIATTADIRDGDFASGNYAFSGGTGASVVNQGTIKAAKGGSVVLSGASVSNQGLIQADTGTVVLGGASDFTVDFVGDGLIKYAIAAPAGQADTGETGVSNSGTISAQGGHVVMTARAAANVADAVVNNTGMISATSAKVANGEVVLDGGDGDVAVSGTIDASGTGSGQTGGSVAITGRNVTVADNTRIDVSGDAGGGSVKIGGDAHGAGPLQNAANTHVGSATITADAIHRGNGGTLVVWSNGITDFSGIFSAKGGASGGDGGFAETSGHTLNIGPQAKIDTTAPNGQTGTWLLDPKKIVIAAGEGTSLSGGLLAIGTDPGQTDQVDPMTITNALATTNVTLQASDNIEVDDAVIYSSAHDLNLMAMNQIFVVASIQNTMASGGGAVNLVAGWDGVTAIGSILSTPGSYGIVNPGLGISGDVQIGTGTGPAAVGSVAVGSASGTTTVAAAALSIVDTATGYAHLGFHGAGGGNIVVRTTGDLDMEADDQFAMIGNGSLSGDVAGPVTGDIDIRLGGTVSLFQGEGVASLAVWIGNAATGGETGNVILVAGNTEGNGNVDIRDNLRTDLQGGDFLLGISDPSQTALVTDFIYNSPHTFSLVSAGDVDVNGVIQNDGTGAINVIGGWDGTTVNPAHLADSGVWGNGETGAVFIDASGCGCGPVNASVGSKSGKVTVAGTFVLLEAQDGYAQIGYHGAGGGAITVLSTGDVILDGNSGDFGSYAQIGNGAPTGSITGAVTGDIFLSATGTVVLASDAGCGCGDSPAPVLIGNASGDDPSPPSYSGNITIFAADINDSNMLGGGGFGDSLLHDIVGGDFTLGFTNPGNGIRIHDNLLYNSPHTLSLLSAGDITFDASLQNSGSGGITLVAGWNGTTLDPAHLLDAGVFGNNLGSITIGGPSASGDAAVGSSGGTTTFAAQDVSLTGANGFAQAGYHGTGSGAVVVDALASLGLSGNGVAEFAQIGSGTTFGSNASSGNVTLTAQTITAGADSAVTAAALTATLTGTGGSIGASGAPLRIAANTANVTTNGGSVFLTSPSNGVTLAGVSLNGGALTLSAGGAIAQTAAIHVGALNVSTTTGAITLLNGGNSFGALTVATQGSDAASLTSSGPIVVAGAQVGGTFTLNANGTISQTGALTAGGLVLSANGAIALNNAGNSFATLALATAGTNNASVTDSTAVALGASTVGGTLTLASDGAISQTGAITAGGLVLSANGAIVLNNSGNSFATLAVTTSGANDASLADATAVTLGASTVGGRLTLSAGGVVAQSGALATHGLTLSTTSGGIMLTNTGNAVAGLVQFNASGAVTFSNTLATSVGTSSAGGDLTLLSKGNVNFLGSVQSNTGNVTAVAGWDGTTTNAALFGNAGVFGNNNAALTVGGTGAPGNVAVGSKSGTTSIYAWLVNVGGAHGYAQLGYHGSGGGAILVRALHDMNLTGGVGYAMLGNGSLTADVTGNITGDIDVRVGGSANFSSGGGSAIAWFGNVAHSGTESGNGILLLNEESDTNESDALANFISADLAGGDFTLGFTGLGDQGPDHNVGYTSAHTFNLLVAGNAVMAGSIQNAGTGAINLVAGWDGHTLSGFGAAGVSGNGGHGVVIGGGDASGGVAFGSAGSTSVYGASLALSAVNGYAQLGFNGHGSGAILVNVTGGVTLTGGAASGEFAQIGNGGLKTSGNNSGDITIVAGGDLALNGGAGSEAYAQVGEGGAESNTGSSGYNNTAAITVTAANVLLNAGGGSAAYTMIGNGGYKSGLNLAGAGVNGGNITITSGHAVTLHGNGADAFAQIGNGGSQSNLNPSAAATGTDSGDIVVHAPNGAAGAVTLAAGTGANSYAQIGNGGYAVNSGGGAVAANFTITGNVSVTDLSLTGGNGGANSFADIGNGDASLNSVGNISGNIFIDANGQITFVNGTAPHSPATIGNFTGLGLIVGLLTGVQLPSDISTNPAALGVIASNTANNKSNTNGITTISTIAITPPEGAPPGATDVGSGTGALGPIAMLDNGNDSTAPNTSDNATVVIADSLDGTKKAVSSQTILAGMLKQTSPTGAGQTVHGVPSADQDFSSEGNEAFWQ